MLTKPLLLEILFLLCNTSDNELFLFSLSNRLFSLLFCESSSNIFPKSESLGSVGGQPMQTKVNPEAGVGLKMRNQVNNSHDCRAGQRILGKDLK